MLEFRSNPVEIHFLLHEWPQVVTMVVIGLLDFRASTH